MTRPFPHILPLMAGIVLLPFILVGRASICYADPQADAVPFMDWYPTHQLGPEQQQKVGTGCCGAYVDPLANNTIPTKMELEQEALTVSGENSQITKTSTVVTGNVELLQGGRKITGDKAELFHDPQAVELEGHVGFREPGFLLRGEKASVNLEDDTLSLEQAHYVLHEAHVHGDAAHILRNDKGVIWLQDSTYSYCEPQKPLWQLHSSTMSLDFETGQGEASHVRLEVFDIPIFYFPYLRFPIGGQRQSGFLTPSLSNGESGLDITLPYYFNLAPNYDLTVIPRSIENRGLQMGAEFRHLSSLFESTISATWLNHDREANNEDRWLAGIKTDGGAHQPWSAHADAARVSDINYFEDLNNSGLSISRATHLKQEATIGYMTPHWDTDITLLNYQTLRDNADINDPYEQIPSLSAQGNYALPNQFSLNLFDQFTQFAHHDNAQITGERFISDASLSWNNASQAYSITPTLYVYHRAQQLDNKGTQVDYDTTLTGFSLDNSLFFEHSGDQYLQILQPRLFFSYTEYKNQNDSILFDSDDIYFGYDQLYTSRRMTGGDRVGDTHHISLGLNSRWLRQNDGREWMRFGLGQTFYQSDRRVMGFDPSIFGLLPASFQERYTRSHSPFAAQWQWNFYANWYVDGDIAWRETDGKTEQGSLSLHHKGEGGQLFSTSYHHSERLTELGSTTYIMETVQQGDVSGYWPLNNQWALTGSIRYDFSHNRYLETLAGFQYEDCCWRLRAAFRQWKSNPDEVFDTNLHENNQGIYFEIQFKNLASTGNKISSMLKDSIYGYSSND